jgi:hypothetical protein
MQGEAVAWGLLAACDPLDVCVRSWARYSAEEGSYALAVFGLPVVVDPAARTLTASAPESEFVLTKLAYFSRISILRYLLDARKIDPTGRLIKPTELKTGQIYLKGSHLLPLDKITARFARDPAAFVRQAAQFGAESREYGDAAVELRPLPRVPITLIFWQEDEEFPARSYLLFDETCEQHLPPDIIWSVAMMCGLVMLKH